MKSTLETSSSITDDVELVIDPRDSRPRLVEIVGPQKTPFIKFDRAARAFEHECAWQSRVWLVYVVRSGSWSWGYNDDPADHRRVTIRNPLTIEKVEAAVSELASARLDAPIVDYLLSSLAASEIRCNEDERARDAMEVL